MVRPSHGLMVSKSKHHLSSLHKDSMELPFSSHHLLNKIRAFFLESLGSLLGICNPNSSSSNPIMELLLSSLSMVLHPSNHNMGLLLNSRITELPHSSHMGNLNTGPLQTMALQFIHLIQVPRKISTAVLLKVDHLKDTHNSE